MKVISFWRHFVSFVAFALMYLPTAASAQAPSFSIDDVEVEEEVEGRTAYARFTITLSGILPQFSSFAVMYTTSAGTATGGRTCGGDADFVTSSAILPFTDVLKKQTIAIPICPDTVQEAKETFTVNLSAASGALIADGQGQAAIIDNDAPRTIRMENVSRNEGNSGQTTFAFPVSLSAPLWTVPVEARYGVWTTDGSTATSGSACGGATDVISASGSVRFNPGETRQTINVAVCGDTTSEPNETFRLVIYEVMNAEQPTERAIGTIINDDNVAPPVLSVADVTWNEPDNSRPGSISQAMFMLRLSSSAHNGCSIAYTCVRGSATPSTQTSGCSTGSDYRPVSGTVRWSANEGGGRAIMVPVCWDNVREGNETFLIQLSNPIGLTAPDTTAVCTIIDND